MRKQIFGLLAVPLLSLVSNAALGLAVVCSNGFLPDAESPATSQQLVWSNYDYWYSAIYVVRDALMEETAPDPGAHSVPGRAAQNYLLAGYPVAWGIDSFLDIECPPAQETAHDPTPPDADPQASMARTSGLRSLPACNPATAACPADVLALLARNGAGEGVSTSAVRDGWHLPSVVATGMIQVAADGVLIVFTDTGRYVTMVLPSEVTLTRRTDVTLEDLIPGDMVGAMLGIGEQGEREALQFRIYRGAARDNVALSRLENETAAPAGLEVRGVVRSVTRADQAGSIRLAYAQREADLPIARNATVAVIEAAQVRELQPFSGRVRALAMVQDDGSLSARSVEILDTAGTQP